ncbi:MAG: HYExAFE family protein [Fimbriiglobus sp.]
MIRSNHYEVAFEAYLRDREIAFVAVDEAKRSTLGDELVKSLDFIIVGPESSRLVVDVKGRRFPGGKATAPRKVWQNWAEQEDISGLIRWATHFGPDFRGVLAFVYEIVPPFEVPHDTPDLYLFKDKQYLMRAIPALEYQKEMRPRSRRWGTVHLPTSAFRDLVRPFSEMILPIEQTP